jgi:hypothetical protein
MAWFPDTIGVFTPVGCTVLTRQVDRDGVLEDLLGVGLVRVLRGDPGVRDYDVDTAELADPVLDRGAQGDAVAHVGLRGDDPPIERLDARDGLLRQRCSRASARSGQASTAFSANSNWSSGTGSAVITGSPWSSASSTSGATL